MGKDKEHKKQKSKKKDKNKDKEKRLSWAYSDSDEEENEKTITEKYLSMLDMKSSKKKSKKEKRNMEENKMGRDNLEFESPFKKLKDPHNPKVSGSSVSYLEELQTAKVSKKVKTNVEESSKKSSKKSDNDGYRINAHIDDDEDEVHCVNDEMEVQKEVEHQEVVNDDLYIEEEVGWSKEDVLTLLSKMDKVIPDKDSLKYSSRVDRLNWPEIQFKGYSAEECKEKWKIIEKKIRGYRILRELISDARVWVEKPWSDFYKSQKKNRHPDMPKRPLTSYMLFYMDKKDKYSKKNPNLGMAALSKIIADKFHKLSPSRKEKYINKAKSLRDEYNEKMKHFVETHPNISLVAKKKAVKNEMPGPPKPLPPKKLFLDEKLKNYEGNIELSKSEIAAEIKQSWKILSEKKKVPWIRWAKEAETKYLEELDVYKSQNPNFIMPRHKSILSKEEKSILERMDGKPEKPPNSAYSLFSRLMLKNDQMKLKKLPPTEKMKEISILWAATSEEEKKHYSERAKRLADIYKLEYATYLESLPEDKRKEELARNQNRKKRKTDTESNTDLVKGKKLKQIKIQDSFKKKKADEGESDDLEDDELREQHDIKGMMYNIKGGNRYIESNVQRDDILKNPKIVQKLKNKIQAAEPKKPINDPFLLFKEIYMTNPGNKESKTRIMWNAMPDKEKERYKKKLEAKKQNYLFNYREFLSKLNPHELTVYSEMKKNSNDPNPCQISSDDESSSDDDSSESSLEINKHPLYSGNTAKALRKTEESSSSSNDSD